jgi:DNA recombination protein RmuC
MTDPLVLVAAVLAAIAALAALAAAARAGRSKPADASATLQAQRVESELQNVVQSLTRINAAQSEIDRLRQPMDELLAVFQNKQARGQYGEARLEELVRDALPVDLFAFQVTLSNGKIADCVVGRGAASNHICVDSKFPLESYQRLLSGEPAAPAQFRTALKAHIDAIASKYIIPGETSRLAVMFIPSEAIYAELFTSFSDLEQYANAKHVVFASPNTLHALLATVSMFHVESKMGEQALLIQQEVGALARDVELLAERIEKLATHMRQAGDDISGAQTSVKRIVSRGERIARVELGGEDPGARTLSDGGRH